MATRADYRGDLKDKLLGLEDEGYGDFEFTDPELNTYLELSVARLYPALYKRVSQDNLSVVSYGTNRLGYVNVTYPERVYLVEDATELTSVRGWDIRPTRLVGFDTDLYTKVNVYYHDAYELANDDSTDLGVSAVFRPLIVLGALVEALESRHDTGVRPDPTSGHQETQLIDRLTRRYEDLREQLAMSLPVAQV